MLRVGLVSVIVSSLVACAGKARAPAAVPASGDATGSAAAVASDEPAPVFDDPFAALLDEHARALVARAAPELASLGAKRVRTAVIVRVIWQTITNDPVGRIEAMAFLLPDGRVRWGVLGSLKESGGVQVSSGLVYPEGVLSDGLRRPLVAGLGDCDLPLIPIADVMTLPEVAREDTFLHGYGKADACRIAAGLADGVWVPSLDWFGVILRAGDEMTFVTAPVTVDRAVLTFGAPTATSMPFGERARVLDGAGAPRCDAAADCFDLGERAALTGERALVIAAYARACDLGHGLSCIHSAGFDDDPAKAEDHRERAVAAFRAGCERGTGLDCAYLGIALETGQGTAKDEKAAVAAYGKACKADDALGCFNLGGMHREGRGTRKDPKAARASYQRACDLGDAGGCDAVSSTKP